MNSLDPRVNRLPKIGVPGTAQPKAPLDQFTTFEVFVQPKEGKPFQHEGIVHAPNIEMAYVFAKENFTRRFLCVSLYVVGTQNVYVSPTTEGDIDAYDKILEAATQPGEKTDFEIYHLYRRGKQHIHVGSISASSSEEAISLAKRQFKSEKIVYNIWAIRRRDIRFTTPEEKDFWNTLPEKKFRDAADYKGGEKLKSFLDRTQ